MSLCPYCGNDAAPVSAHLLPEWYRIDADGAALVMRTDREIADTCAQCRARMADANEYARKVFETQLSQRIYRDTVAGTGFDHALLARWLLRLSFDWARANHEDTRILAQYRAAMLGDAPVPAELVIWLRTIAPSTPAGYLLAPATQGNRIVALPEWFRVGTLGDNCGCEAWCLRQVVVNSHCFAVCMPDRERLEYARDERIYRSGEIDAALGDAVWIGPRSDGYLPQPTQDALSFTLENIGAFHLGCERIDDASVAAVLCADAAAVEWRIPREDIERAALADTLAFLAPIAATRESCLRFQERVRFGIEGYRHEPQLLLEDVDVTVFLRHLDQAWPYWMFFLPDGHPWLKLASACLGGDFGDTVRRWFTALNYLCHVYGIDDETNRRLSAQAYAMLS